MKSAFDEDPALFKSKDQREQGRRDSSRRSLAGQENQGQVRVPGLRLKLAQLVVTQAPLTEIATDQIEKPGGHQFLEQPQKLLFVLGRFDRNEVPEIHALLLQRQGHQRRIEADPSHPFLLLDGVSRGLDPERSASGAECA